MMLIFAASMLLTACSNDKDIPSDPRPIKISYAGLLHQGLLRGLGKLNGNRLFLEYEIVLILVWTPSSPDDALYLFGEVVLDKK